MKFLHGKYPIVDENSFIDRLGNEKRPAVTYWDWEGPGQPFRMQSKARGEQIILEVPNPTEIQLSYYLEAMNRFLGPKEFSKWLINSKLLK